MKINKILNNNAVVVKEGTEEKIVMGAGIAFQKRKNDVINQHKIEKIFVMSEENEKFQELLRSLPEEVIDIAEEIISYAEGYLQVPLSNHIHIGLTDHLSFAINRTKSGYPIKNKLLNEIKTLYAKEFHVGEWAIRYVKEQIGLTMPEDEAGHIALHIHTAKLDSSNMQSAIKHTSMITELLELLEERIGYPLQRNSISHQRMVTHLHFALNRFEMNEPFHDIDPDMLDLIKSKHEEAYRYAQAMGEYVEQEYNVSFPLSEVGYIALHIQRIIDRT
ncbi:PRD domain-containing protein [Pontibacillus salicampi]|uniref:PRD domain-containing protein n=1 Tax=Pontibacillus salicampi TaxID=1449801 RepID=A0ABV6LMG0_9BACI